MQSYYAARAGEYDGVYQKPERQADLRQIEQWLPSVLSGKTVLEVACGTGYWTQFIAPVASSVVAIDSAPETLRIAERRVPSGNVLFQVGDAYALAQGSRRFSAAFAGFWFSHVPLERQREFLRGLNSALEPGAKVVLLDNRSSKAALRRSPGETPTATRTNPGRSAMAQRIECSRTSSPSRNCARWPVRVWASPLRTPAGSSTGHSNTSCPSPNPSIERTSSSRLRLLPAAAHVERQPPGERHA